MCIFPLFRATCKTIGSIVPTISSVEPLTGIINRKMHYVCNKSYSYNLSNIYTSTISTVLLQPSLPMYNLTCGLKMKTVLHRRCKHCILMWKNDRKYIICKDKPRHNQVERKKKPYNTWLLTFASQSKVREW